MKQLLIDILDFLRFQLVNDHCTAEQMKAIHDSLTKEIAVEATADDLAKFFGQSKENVRNVLSRSPMPKPKRRVYYSFISFLKHIPKTWRRETTAEKP